MKRVLNVHILKKYEAVRYASSLSTGQRLLLTPYFAIGAITKPENGQYIAGLADTISTTSLVRLRAHLQGTSEGRKMLIQKPLYSNMDLEHLKSMDVTTFGRKYYDWMNQSNNFSIDDRAPVRFVADEELEFIMMRYRQIHDFLHVITGFDVSILGELGLKWFEYFKTGFTFCLLSGTFGQLRLNSHERRFLNTVLLPWAIKSSRDSRDIFTFRYEEYFDHDIISVRSEFRITEAPKVVKYDWFTN